MLKDLKKVFKDKESSVKTKSIKEEVQDKDLSLSNIDKNILETWNKEEQQLKNVVPLIPPKLNLVFLPHLLTEAFLPSRKVESPYKYQRRYGNLSIQISSSTYPVAPAIPPVIRPYLAILYILLAFAKGITQPAGSAINPPKYAAVT